MVALRTIAAAATLLIAASPDAQPGSEPAPRWQPIVAEASRRFGVPEAWIAAVMLAESGGHATRGGRPIISSAGAMGLMQVMPATYIEMRRRFGLGADPYDPHDNILAGAAYLKLMYQRFGYPGLFAAYNAGPARYAEYLAGGRPLPAETRAYLATLVRTASSAETRPTVLPGERLFFPIGSEPQPTFDHGIFVKLNTHLRP